MAAPIKIVPNVADDKENINSSENESTVCKICLKEKFKYTCPRCNLMYCSVTCYKDEKHVSCSEAFYKDWVLQELQDMKNIPEDKQKVIEMLKRNLEDRDDLEGEDEEGDEEEDESDLAARLEGLDLDKDISTVWSRLSEKEKEEFARMFQDGRLANLIEIWTPWWKCSENLKLVRDPDSSSSMPSILSDIQDINSILKNTRPSSDLRFDVVNILFAYVYVTRVHNGSHLECPVDACQLMTDVCDVLGKQERCGSVGEAVQMFLDSVDKVGKKGKESSLEFNLSILDDLEALMTGPSKNKPGLTFMSAAFSDLIQLFRNCYSVVKKELKELKKQQRKTSSDNSSSSTAGDLESLKSNTFKVEKKLMFMLSWLQRYGMGMHQLLPLLQLEKEVRQGALEDVKETKATVEDNMDKLKPNTESTSAPSKNKSKIVELS